MGRYKKTGGFLNWEKMIDSKKSCMNNGRFEIDFTEVSKETSYCWKEKNSSNIYRLFFFALKR